jgi:hypothetical protein
MFPKGGQIMKYCFLAMFPEDGQTRKHCFLAEISMFPSLFPSHVSRRWVNPVSRQWTNQETLFPSHAYFPNVGKLGGKFDGKHF